MLKTIELQIICIKVKVNFMTLVEVDPKAPFTIATTLRCRLRKLTW